MMTFFRTLGLLVAAGMAAASPALAETITVGAYPANPPWEYKTDSGAFEGFEVDLAKEIAKRIGADVEFQDLGFQALFAATSSSRIDFAISSISVNNERLKNQGFTQPYYDSDGTIFSVPSSPIRSLDDLKGKIVGVLSGSTGEAWAKANAEKLGFAEIKGYNAQQDLLLEVQNGRLDAGATEISGLQFAMTKMPGLKILLRIPTGEHFAMMTRKGHPLLQRVNDTISAIKTDGTMAAIHKKWFGVDPEPGTTTVVPGPIPQAQ
ncbi:ABC transporter substrate-binding protein [Inquilinus sp. CA228]|uniref:ABC transporter substrate-binding protein n=1 Tax=Inquilinus sp. CA228 TaxID=3455609 RepID=UPI003F8D098D